MLVIDRFEGDLAVIEFEASGQKEMININRAVLPEEAKAGDILKIVIDRGKKEEIKKEINSLADELFE